MPVPYIFEEGQPVDADKVNADFADVLTKITEEITAATGSSSELNQKINQAASKAQTALDKANNSVQLSGNQTIKDTKTFTGTVKVPNSKTVGTAISLAGVNNGDYGGIKLGTGTIINWGHIAVTGDSYRDFNFKYPFTSKDTYVPMVSVRAEGDVDWSPAWYRINGSTVRVWANGRTVAIIAVGS